eukprot:scaffold17829_cov72-Phaeocystis_antarctica.AAC.1
MEEEIPSMSTDAFFQEEEVVPLMPPDAVVKREHAMIVDEGGRSDGRPKRRRWKEQVGLSNDDRRSTRTSHSARKRVTFNVTVLSELQREVARKVVDTLCRLSSLSPRGCRTWSGRRCS